MWSSDSANSARNEYSQNQQKGLNAKASSFKSKTDSLELLIDDLRLNDIDDSRSGATTQERSIRPEEHSGLASIDTLNEWDHSFPQINRRSPAQRLNSSIDREFDYHGQPSWPTLDIVAPESPVMNRGEAFPMRQGSLSNRTYSQDSIPFSSYGNNGPSRTATYDSYHSPAVNQGYHRSSSAYPPPPPSPMTNSYFNAPQGQLAAARPSSNVSTPNKAPRNMDPVDGFVYQVQFKRAHKNYILAPSAPRNIIPGDFVKVEADRGEDMGIVLCKSPSSEFEEVIPTAGYRGRGFSSGQGERKFLFRLATSEERMALVEKVRDEEQALGTIREKAIERCLPMVILDAEYQFDRHKLTFFFEADRRIDFRELVSELFSQYKTRIWMQQVDTSTLSANDAGTELAKATGFLPKRDDRAYLQTAHSLMRGGGGIGGSSAQSPRPQGRPATLGSASAGYGGSEGERGFANTYGDGFTANPDNAGGGGFAGLQTAGRGAGATDRRAPDPWMFPGHH